MKKVLLSLIVFSLLGFVFAQEIENPTEVTESSEAPVLVQAETVEEDSVTEAECSDSEEQLAEENQTEEADALAEAQEADSEEESDESEAEEELADSEVVEETKVVKDFSTQKGLIKTYISFNQEKLYETISPDDLIAQIEDLKKVVQERRQKIQGIQDEYFEKKDEEAVQKADEITNAPLEAIETDDFGTQTKDSIAKRKANVQKMLDDTEKEKQAYSKVLWDSIKEEENLDIAALNKLYSELEMTKYVANSLTGDLKIAVGPFDGKTGKWNAEITSTLLDNTNLIWEQVELPYSEVVGKKYISVDKMSEEQFAEFENNVDMYDDFFSSNTDVLYVKASYKVIRWQNASEYRFMVDGIDIVRFDGTGEKVIHKIRNIAPKIFTEFPVIEIRDEKQIAKEKEKTVNLLEKELKAKERRLGVKLYSDPDVAAKTYNKDPVIQKGRGTVLLSVIDYEDFAAPAVGLDHLQIDATFGLGKFAYLGLDGGMDFNFVKNNMVFNGGVIGGVNVRIGQNFRPYLLAGADYYTNYNVAARAGAGCDIILAKVFCFNVGYSYNFNFGVREFLDKDLMFSIITQGREPTVYKSNNHQISVGVGFSF